MKQSKARRNGFWVIAWGLCTYIYAQFFIVNHHPFLQASVKAVILYAGPVLVLMVIARTLCWFACQKYQQEFENFKQTYYRRYRSYFSYDVCSSRDYTEELWSSGKFLLAQGEVLILKEGITDKQKREIMDMMRKAKEVLRKIA